MIKNFLADFDIQSNIQITPSIIVERINCFRRTLLDLVKTHHRVIFKSSKSFQYLSSFFFEDFFI